MEISVCIITKNECSKLEKCLQCIKGIADEIVVVDTGSTDDTVKMVRDYTSSVYEFDWIDDFAAAKNFAISKAVNDYVLIIDSDEYLKTGRIDELKESIELHPDSVGRFKRLDQFDNDDGFMESITWTNRIFNRRMFHFEHRIHEQIVLGSVFDNLDKRTYIYHSHNMNYNVYDTDLYFIHDGYIGTPEERQTKAERNIIILQKEFEVSPDDPYIQYQLGKSYYMIKDYPKALSFFEKATICDVDAREEWVLDLVTTYGYTLLELQKYDTAIMLEGVKQEFSYSSDYYFMMGLVYMNNALFEEAIKSFFEAINVGNAKVVGTDSFRAYYNIGVIYECLEIRKEALKYYRLARGYDAAKQRICYLESNKR